jgi:ureidoglycolate lyase
VIPAAALTARAYAPYGDVISAARDDVDARDANLGTAARRNFLADLFNDRPHARLNIASFRCAPRAPEGLAISLLEKHPRSTQAFIPMNATRYLVVVAGGGDAPDLSTLRAFVASGTQGITYHPGVWHHPMIALDAPTDFTCLVWEDGTDDDCVVHDLDALLPIALPRGGGGPVREGAS